MDTQIIAIYCLCDDLLKALYHRDDPQSQMTDPEVLTTALVVAVFFAGNIETVRSTLHDQGYIPGMLSKSLFNRRVHRLHPLIGTLFSSLGEYWKAQTQQAVYILDSYPVAACDNYRIRRAKRYQGEVWRGYQASKKRYFYGLKIHVMVTETGRPGEFE